MSEQPEALRLADALNEKPDSDGHCREAAAELRRLHAENDRLRTVMVAAAEEIDSHWEAHCDSEGYGPVNLMRRLEQGIAAEYGYTAGEFKRLRAQRDALLEALKTVEWHGGGSCWVVDADKIAAAIKAAEENT